MSVKKLLLKFLIINNVKLNYIKSFEQDINLRFESVISEVYC